MKREDILAAYLDAPGPREREAIEAAYPDLAAELRESRRMARRVAASRDELAIPAPVALRAWRVPSRDHGRTPVQLIVPAALTSAALAAVFLEGRPELAALPAMVAWLVAWFTMYSPPRRALR